MTFFAAFCRLLATMIAVIETGGKQYLVKPGATIHVEKLPGEKGASFAFDKVLLLADESGGEVKFGTPYIDGASVKGTITDQGRDRKIRVVKFKRKVRYKKVHGHRQHYTSVKIGNIG